MREKIVHDSTTPPAARAVGHIPRIHMRANTVLFNKPLAVGVAVLNISKPSGHQVSTLQMTKTGLCAYDDKRYVLDDYVHTLAHGLSTGALGDT